MRYYSLIILVATTILFTACDKNKDDIIEQPNVNEEELITTLRLIVTNSIGFNQTFDYKVDNGIGSSNPTTPVIDNITLGANTTYNVEIKVYNESVSPVEDITEEVKSESVDHLFLFGSNPISGSGSISFANGSKDSNGAPFNQTINFLTGDAGSGQLTVTLKHEPTDKSATDPGSAGGETDAQAIFPVTIQ